MVLTITRPRSIRDLAAEPDVNDRRRRVRV